MHNDVSSCIVVGISWIAVALVQISSHSSVLTCVLDAQKNCLNEMVLLSTQNMFGL